MGSSGADSTGTDVFEVPAAGTFRVLPQKEGSYDWVRKENDPLSRRLRHLASGDTQEATARGWYINESGERVSLTASASAEAGTQVLRPGVCWPSLPSRCKRTTQIKKVESPTTVASCAIALVAEGRRVAIVSAASAFHAGGGFSTGGRHALEEALCTQSTLYPCLRSVWRNAGCSKGDRYIPQDGAVLCPHVEIFRDGTATGYAPLATPVTVTCVVSIAMPNLSPRVRDAPMDSVADPASYDSALRDRWRAALHAACVAGASDVVVPDAGCGVYMNQPQSVGAALSQVLHTEFPDAFDAVWVVGTPAFFTAVQTKPPEVAGTPNSSRASQLKAKVLPKRAVKAASSEMLVDVPEDTTVSQQVGSPKTLPLSETNLRRWLSKTVRRSSSRLSTTASTATSEPENSDACSGTFGGFTASLVGSYQHDLDSRHFTSSDTFSSGRASPGFGSPSTGVGAPAGAAAAELVGALLQAATLREGMPWLFQPQAPPVAPPDSYTDQPGAELASGGAASRCATSCACPSPRPLHSCDEELDSPVTVPKSPPMVPRSNLKHTPGLALRCGTARHVAL